MRPHVLTVLALLLAGPLRAQAGSADEGAFIVRLGSDTVAVERFWRAGPVLSGRCLTRTPRTTLREYRVFLDSAGGAEGFELRRVRPWQRSDTAAAWTRELKGDQGAAIPAIGGNCWGMWELATRRLVQSGAATASQLTLAPGSPDEVNTVPLARIGRDSVTLEVIANLPYRVAVDSKGRVRGAGWAGDWSVERVTGLDLDPFLVAFAARPLGQLSPADSVPATVGGAPISIHYSRPAMRGRRIFGHIVPWGAVWRTGANEATIFETSADLQIAGQAVPAGKYSLWTVPTPGGWTLILNRNTGQWGTDYDAQHDFLRLPMQVAALPEPRERLTIAVEPRGNRGMLTLEWETTRASVELRTR